MAGSAGRKIIRPQVIEFLSKAPGSTHYLKDLAAGFAVTEKQMGECIAGIIRDEQLPGLEVTIRGRAWVYRPGAESKQGKGTRVFEELAATKSGDLIIQDQDGKLYRAKELE